MIDAITAPLAPIAVWILVASLKGTAVIAVALLCRRLLQRWLTAQGRFVLWIAIVASLALPLGPQIDLHFLGNSTAGVFSVRSNIVIQDNGPSRDLDAGAAGTTQTATDIVADEETTRSNSTRTPVTHAVAQTPSFGDGVRSWLIAAWLGVALGLLTFVLISLMRYFRVRADACNVDSEILRLFLQCKSQLKLNRAVRLLETSQLQVPTLFGWWSPTLLLPSRLTKQLSTDQLRHVFLHELTHVRRQDVLVNWLT